MLWYIKCPTCSRIISKNLDKYQEELKFIRENPNMSKEEKDEAGAALLDKYRIRKVCCRARILGLIPYHEIILT